MNKSIITSDPEKLGNIVDDFTNISIIYDDNNISKMVINTKTNNIYEILIDTEKLCCERFSNELIGNLESNINNLDYIYVTFRSNIDTKYADIDNSNDAFNSIELLYINFCMKDNRVYFLRNVCITNGYYRHHIKIIKNEKIIFKSYI